ncbi:MAG: hypothetical protein JSR96_01375 [Proteobacteria bacterium]|nr:hypothetical protein [Pseudomonadota bacterium]
MKGFSDLEEGGARAATLAAPLAQAPPLGKGGNCVLVATANKDIAGAPCNQFKPGVFVVTGAARPLALRHHAFFSIPKTISIVE